MSARTVIIIANNGVEAETACQIINIGSSDLIQEKKTNCFYIEMQYVRSTVLLQLGITTSYATS